METEQTEQTERMCRRYEELRYRMMECALDPDHPATRANRARWTREFRQLETALNRRGLLQRA